MTATRAAHAVATLRRLPLLAIVHKLAHLIPFRPVDVSKLCFLRFDGVPFVSPSMIRGRTTVRRGTSADLAGLATLQDRRAIFESRFAEGDHCVVACADGRIVGFEWFSDRDSHREAEWGYEIAIPPGSVYAYDAYVDPQYRNSGVWIRFKAYMSDWMSVHGKRDVITFVEHGNLPSLRTHLRFGFAPEKTVLAIKILWFTVFRC